MKKNRNKKALIWILLILLLLMIHLVYSRSMSLAQLYPMLAQSNCTVIRGYYEVGQQEDLSEFAFEPDTEEFQQLWELFYGQKYRRTLRDLLPGGTRYHNTKPEDFQWDVYFYFENIEFPDGSSGSPALHFQNFYGELDIWFDGERHSCKTKGQDVWAKAVLDLIQ